MNDAPGNPKPRSLATIRARILLAGAAALIFASWAWTRRDKTPAAIPEPAERPMPTRLQPEALSQLEADREAPPVSDGYRREVVRPNPVKNVAQAVAPADDPPAGQEPRGTLQQAPGREEDAAGDLPHAARGEGSRSAAGLLEGR